MVKLKTMGEAVDEAIAQFKARRPEATVFSITAKVSDGHPGTNPIYTILVEADHFKVVHIHRIPA